MREEGLGFDANIPNVGTIDAGLQVISSLLHYDSNFPLSPTNQPRLRVTTDCPNVIKAFTMFCFTDVSDPIKGLFKKVSEEYKDAIDAVRYTVLWPIPATDAQIKQLQDGRMTPELLAAENYD